MGETRHIRFTVYDEVGEADISDVTGWTWYVTRGETIPISQALIIVEIGDFVIAGSTATLTLWASAYAAKMLSEVKGPSRWFHELWVLVAGEPLCISYGDVWFR